MTLYYIRSEICTVKTINNEKSSSLVAYQAKSNKEMHVIKYCQEKSTKRGECDRSNWYVKHG